MPSWTRKIPFQVDIAGIIELMGASLYSRLDVPIRELIQNAHDGIMRRRQVDLGFQGRIEIQQCRETGCLRFCDDGIGLSPQEAEKYLGTLGIGVTGLLKRRSVTPVGRPGDGQMLIGQFGIGLFSGFMLAERIVVESRRLDCTEGVRWEAGLGTQIELSSWDGQRPGTSVTLHLKPEHRGLTEEPEVLEAAIREYAEFLPVPIHLNSGAARVNVIQAPWFDTTPDREAVELELEAYFRETPLDVIPLRVERPVTVRGALYVTPQRTPGFGDDATVAVTVQRMVISRKIQGLLPPWASFLRGLLELPDCAPTASREDLVRDGNFEVVRRTLDELLMAHFEQMAREEPARIAALIAWHRYTLAGSALTHQRLRRLLAATYRFATSQGELTFEEIFARSPADPLLDGEWDHVLWYNPDRRQEQWMNNLFVDHPGPCVHTVKSFEESLLAALAGDVAELGASVDLRVASPGTNGFAAGVLGLRDLEEASAAWQGFLATGETKVYLASCDSSQPVVAFLNEQRELQRTIEQLKKDGTIPSGFQRMIDSHFDREAPRPNEVILNRRHKLVSRVLGQSTGSPLASVLRMLVVGALHAAGMAMDRTAHQQQADDLEWIAEALWGPEG